MKIAELLHFCLTAKRSGVIQMDHQSDKAYIYITDGEVISACFQELSGEKAFFKIMLLETTEPEFKEKTVSEQKTITKSTHFLLMEAARLSDEASGKTSAKEDKKNLQTKRYSLQFITLDDAKFELLGKTVFIGRGSDCDITVPDVSVSTKHCQILWNGKDHILSDAGSSNGTYLNNEKIDKSHTLTEGDHIQVGLCHFSYQSIKEGDVLQDPQSVVPFTFGSETQKIQLPPKNETGASKFASEAAFKEYKPVAEDKKKIHIWPFGKK